MASIVRNATAVWVGAGKDGRGTLTTQSGTLDEAPYSFAKRFGEEQGTNPEELIAAAHAGCFSMALAFQLSGAGHVPDQLQTKADLTIVQEGGGWRIDAITLNLNAKVPGISREDFLKLAETAKANCPVSKVLNAQISLKAELE
jgi:osmotically inducible protein OsmC